MTARAPVHTRLRQVATIRPSNVDKKGLPDETRVRLCNYTDVYYNDEILDDAEFMVATATPDQVTSFTLRAGDVLITKDSESPDDIGVPAYVPEDLEGVLCGYHLSLVRPNRTRIHPKFLFWALKSAAARSSMSAAALGITRFALRSIEVANLEVPLPEMNAQIQTADFLDRETARIDSLVVKKDAVLECVRERALSLIQFAVRGADGEGKLSETAGLEWLGSTRAEWPTPQIGMIADIYPGVGFPDAYQGQQDGMFPLLKASDLVGAWPDDLGIDSAANRVDADVARILHGKPAPKGTIVFPRIGAALYGRNRRILRRAALFDNNLVGIKFHQGSPEYWARLLLCLDLRGIARPGPVPSVSGGQLAAVKVPFPPPEEQTGIAQRLHDKLGPMRQLAMRVEHQVAKIHEHRQALITAAVTGQLDIDGQVA